MVTWKEVAGGTITRSTEDGEIIRTIRHGRRPETGNVKLQQLSTDDLANLRAKMPSLRLVTVANGAQDNWRFLEQSFPAATQVLDFFHAAEYIPSAVELADGKNDTAGQQFEKLRHCLLREVNGVEKVLCSRRYLRTQHNPAIAKSVRYFSNNKHRMKYAEHQAEKLMIGSGLVESTNKNLVARRLKPAGMRWRPEGGQAILTLRSLVLSERFDTAWEILQNRWQN